jgi:hypothetical protein
MLLNGEPQAFTVSLRCLWLLLLHVLMQWTCIVLL